MARTRGSIGSVGSGKPKRAGQISDLAVTEIRRLIMQRGDPLDVLCRVSRGEGLRQQDGTILIPSIDHRLYAAKVLLGKILPDASPLDSALQSGSTVNVSISIGPPAPRLVAGSLDALEAPSEVDADE